MANNDQDKEEKDDLTARFPNVESDPRLNIQPDSILPDAPKLHIERPVEKTYSSFGGTPRMRAIVASQARGSGLASSVGVQLVAAIAGFTGLGVLADKFLLHSGQTPWGLIVGFMIGVAVGFWQVFRLTQKLNDEAKGGD